MDKPVITKTKPTPSITFHRFDGLSGNMVFHPGAVQICRVFLDVDGFWKMQAESFGTGLIESGHMKAVCSKLDEMNQGFEDELEAYFASLPPRSSPAP